MRHRISQHHTCRISFISLSSLHSSDVLVQYWQMLLSRSPCRRGEYCRQSHRGEYKRYFDWFICSGSTRWLLSPLWSVRADVSILCVITPLLMTTVEGGIAEAGGAQMCYCMQIVPEDLCVGARAQTSFRNHALDAKFQRIQIWNLGLLFSIQLFQLVCLFLWFEYLNFSKTTITD